ncbi:MAG: hypothetical protein HY774_27400 [Acidobacteria bacterium]|nr:hypothetical protein [Acidobacteriota bacterium]
MSSEDPTRNYPSPESYETRNDLKQMLFEVLREVLAQEVIPRFDKIESRLDKIESRLDKIESRLDRIESRLEAVERSQKELLRDFRLFKAQTENRLFDLEYPQSSQSVK